MGIALRITEAFCLPHLPPYSMTGMSLPIRCRRHKSVAIRQPAARGVSMIIHRFDRRVLLGG
ncbi:MAG: hypothetical protein J0H32_15440, partial [Rhizobiales bacterium]|nr:hypothetical protein [Hyphomicrobiales bacterium]